MSEPNPPNVPTRRFFGYPEADEGPKVPYLKKDDANPIFGGIVLVIGAVSNTTSFIFHIVLPVTGRERQPYIERGRGCGPVK